MWGEVREKQRMVDTLCWGSSEFGYLTNASAVYGKQGLLSAEAPLVYETMVLLSG